jgi:hypothetical protein
VRLINTTTAGDTSINGISTAVRAFIDLIDSIDETDSRYVDRRRINGKDVY